MFNFKAMPEISEQLNSEEIDEDDDDEEEEEEERNEQHRQDEELRHYESAGSNDDEFFLVSTTAAGASPFNLASVATARSGYQPDSFQLIDQSVNDSDMTAQSYNRLSNIIEEDDDYSSEQHRNNGNNEAEKSIPPAALNQLDDESIEQYREMLKLGEEVSNLYKNIQNELSRPVVETMTTSGSGGVVVDYKPVMKKRIYHLNGAYLKNAPNEIDSGI